MFLKFYNFFLSVRSTLFMAGCVSSNKAVKGEGILAHKLKTENKVGRKFSISCKMMGKLY